MFNGFFKNKTIDLPTLNQHKILFFYNGLCGFPQNPHTLLLKKEKEIERKLMKMQINSEILKDSLDSVIKCVNNNNIYLPLRSLFIEITEDKVSIIGSDGNLSTIKTIRAEDNILKIVETSTILVPSLLFSNIIKKCEGTIDISSKRNILFIESGDNKYEINLSDISEYPAIDFTLHGAKLSINVKEFRDAAKNVLFAAATTDVDVIFSGVNIDYSGNIMKLIATDSYRVAYQEMEIKDSRNLNFNVSLYAKNLKEFIPEPKYMDGEVEMYVSDHKMNIVYSDTIIQSKLIDAPYKDVTKIFPEGFSKTLTIEKKELIDAIDRATVISADAFHRLRFEINQKEIKIISVKEEIGNSNVTIKTKNYVGDDLVLTVNHKFLKDALSVFNGEIQMKMNESIDRFVIIGKSNPKNKQLIAPQRSY